MMIRLCFFVFLFSCISLSHSIVYNITLDINALTFVRQIETDYRFLYQYKLCKEIQQQSSLEGGFAFMNDENVAVLYPEGNETYIRALYDNSGNVSVYGPYNLLQIHEITLLIEGKIKASCVFSKHGFVSLLSISSIIYNDEKQENKSEVEILIHDDVIYLIFNTKQDKRIGIYLLNNSTHGFIDELPNQDYISKIIEIKGDNVELINLPLYYRVFNHYYSDFILLNTETSEYYFNKEYLD